jgi:hypothetical protein
VSNAHAEVLQWAQRVLANKGQPAYTLLEIAATASAADAQQAFYKIARVAHPDLHRNHMSREELDLVTAAYSTAAGAYQEFRSQAAAAQRMRAGNTEVPAAGGAAPPGSPRRAAGPTAPPPSGIPSAPVEQQMNQRALLYYRKAEIALRRGDLKGAILQIKMAIASDSASAFLRTALAEVETELRKGS